ncbi:DUF998 domain-containing protein [Longispora albida]|uniref:DUF998 domain-containing protein n=1 Tax=Longispora albida TaxID=203523 RepID=UPI00037B71E3|nr:DUF998 domain-containing protein [Longispora albida]
MAAVSAPVTSSPTRALLTAGLIGGPLWAAISLGQAATREGFDLTRHPLSALSTGALGWLQITNFLVAGLLATAGAAGLARAMRGTPGGVWVPRLAGISGLGLIAAGLLVVDPGNGFPAGTPDGPPATMSWHGIGHMAAGSVSFIALIAACYVLGRHFSRAGARGWAVASRVAGTALLIGNLWAMSGSPGGSLAIAIGGITAMVWVSVVAGRYR